MYKKKQFETLTNQINEIRDFKIAFHKKMETLNNEIKTHELFVLQKIQQTYDDITEIKDPLMKEVKNTKRENEGLLNEIKRTQNMNREMIGDYLKLMDQKIQGKDEMFITQLA